MNARRLFSGLWLSVLCLAAASPAMGLANRVFVSARSGDNANSCDNIATPCQTLQGAINQLNAGGEAIVLDSGGYGPVIITQGLTIEAPAGVTAFIHPPSGDAITVNAGSETVTLRGLVLNGGTRTGIIVDTVGTLNVENCFITGFSAGGIVMVSGGRLNVKGTDIKVCSVGLNVAGNTGFAQVSIDHCHLDGNFIGFKAATTSPGSSSTMASNSTANSNSIGWECGFGTSGQDVLNLEFCTGSDNADTGLVGGSNNAVSTVRYSNCIFANNTVGVSLVNFSSVVSRGNNTITGNTQAQTSGPIGTFAPM